LGYLITLRDAWNNPNTKYDLSKMKKTFSLEELEAEIKKQQSKSNTNLPTVQKAEDLKSSQEIKNQTKSTIGKYIAGEAEKTSLGLVKGEKVIIEKVPNGWKFYGVQSKSEGSLGSNEIKGIIKSLRDEFDQPITSDDFDKLLATISSTNQVLTTPDDQKQKHVLPTDKLSYEQKEIDKKFEKIVNSNSNSHIVIRALAGSGKTTMLKHLAWKYGKPGQKWLYLVFNTKNKIEATEKFPPWVQVKTTNGFLGEILNHNKNSLKISQTNRIAELAKGSEEKVPNKIRIIADSQEFKNLCSNRFGIPDEQRIKTSDKTILSLIRSIRYSFKEQVIELTEKCKSHSINPKDEKINERINEIFNKYEIDSELSEVKKRISKYSSGEWLNKLLNSLSSYLGYDIRNKDFKEEIISATLWILLESYPGATKIQYEKRDKNGLVRKVDLNQYRDFTDDLWYAAIYADKIHWPKYDFVLADEVQDFNECQKITLRKLSQSGAKIVAVGDENQSIYGFRGADTKAFNNLSSELENLSQEKEVEHSLTTNYRSRPGIINFVNNSTKVKKLKGKVFEDGQEGQVTDKEKEYENVFDIIKKENEEKKMQETAFISRTNQPLTHAALKLLSLGIPFVILGKDLAKDLIKHTEKIMKFKKLNPNNSVQELHYALQSYLDDEIESHGDQSSKKAYLQDLKETTEALLRCIDQFSSLNESIENLVLSGLLSEHSGLMRKDIQSFILWLKEKLSGLNIEESEKDFKSYKEKVEKEKPVILTTSHKSKGLEFDRVYILRDDQFPHPKAKREEELEQEENAKYVAYTRAKDQLHIVKLDGQPGYEKK
jgi:DNA helicase-2/ATP-dependent DNA helicase PcrA